jgi:hypothetical protein
MTPPGDGGPDLLDGLLELAKRMEARLQVTVDGVIGEDDVCEMCDGKMRCRELPDLDPGHDESCPALLTCQVLHDLAALRTHINDTRRMARPSTRDAALREEGRADARVMLIANETGDLLAAAKEEGRAQGERETREARHAAAVNENLLRQANRLLEGALDALKPLPDGYHIDKLAEGITKAIDERDLLRAENTRLLAELSAARVPTPDASQGSAPVCACGGVGAQPLNGPGAWRCQRCFAALAPTAAPQGSPLPGGGDAPAKPWMCRCPRAAGIQRIGSSNGLGPPLEGPWACIVCNTPVISGAHPEGGALEGEMAEALRRRVDICGIEFPCQCEGGFVSDGCLACEQDEALLARYDASKAIPQGGDEKGGT